MPSLPNAVQVPAITALDKSAFFIVASHEVMPHVLLLAAIQRRTTQVPANRSCNPRLGTITA